MAAQINLLPRKGAREVLRERSLGRLKKGSVIVLSVYAVLLIAVFGIRGFVLVRKSTLEEQVRLEKVKVDAFSVTESQQVLLKAKLVEAGGLIKTRKDWAKFLAQVVSFIPDENSITGVSLSSEGTLRISLETSRLQEAALLLKALVRLGLTDEQIKTISLENVEKTTEGTYSFTVLIST